MKIEKRLQELGIELPPPVTPGANATKIQKGRLRELAQALLAQ